MIEYDVVSASNGTMLFRAPVPHFPRMATRRSEAVLWARRAGRSCAGAALADIHLADQDLSGMNFSNAVFHSASLPGSILKECNLSGAYMNCVNLEKVDFTGANLTGTTFAAATLFCARLDNAVIDLNTRWDHANLTNTSWEGVDMSQFNPDYATMSGMCCSDEQWAAIDFSRIRADFMEAVQPVLSELEFLRDAIIGGLVDGSTYEGACCCLAGTLEHALGGQLHNAGDEMHFTSRLAQRGFKINSQSLREAFYMGISVGDTPETSRVSALALKWVDEAIEHRDKEK